MVLSFDILRNEIHRPRTVKGNSGDDVFQALWAKLLHEALHPCTFYLENTVCLAGSDIVKYCFIIII